MIELAIALFISVCLNLVLLWYTRNTLSNLLYISENIYSLYETVSGFGDHLKTVYELERFYGDPTLTNVLEHANAVREEIEGYEQVLFLSELLDTEEEEEEETDGTEEA